jgi:hypothetical protein
MERREPHTARSLRRSNVARRDPLFALASAWRASSLPDEGPSVPHEPDVSPTGAGAPAPETRLLPDRSPQ